MAGSKTSFMTQPLESLTTNENTLDISIIILTYRNNKCDRTGRGTFPSYPNIFKLESLPSSNIVDQ